MHDSAFDKVLGKRRGASTSAHPAPANLPLTASVRELWSSAAVGDLEAMFAAMEDYRRWEDTETQLGNAVYRYLHQPLVVALAELTAPFVEQWVRALEPTVSERCGRQFSLNVAHAPVLGLTLREAESVGKTYWDRRPVDPAARLAYFADWFVKSAVAAVVEHIFKVDICETPVRLFDSGARRRLEREVERLATNAPSGSAPAVEHIAADTSWKHLIEAAIVLTPDPLAIDYRAARPLTMTAAVDRERFEREFGAHVRRLASDWRYPVLVLSSDEPDNLDIPGGWR